MTRGNQRDVARAKAQAKEASAGVKKTGNPQARKEADQAALQAKIAAKAAAAKEAEEKGLPPPGKAKKQPKA